MINIPVVTVKSQMADKEIDHLNISNYHMLSIFRVNIHKKGEKESETNQFYPIFIITLKGRCSYYLH